MTQTLENKINSLVNEALEKGADIEGNQSLGWYLLANKKFNADDCKKLIDELSIIAKKLGKDLNIFYRGTHD